MPEFVMPEVGTPADGTVPLGGAERDTSLTPRLAAAAERAERLRPLPGPRRPWRQLGVAALIGLLVGAGIPAAMQATEQAAADARVDRLRDTAMAYLLAIAAGDAERATSMVPVQGAMPPDAVLRAADRIAQPEVRLTAVDGAAATVEVQYRIAERTVVRSLAADEEDGQWLLRTSLAEPVLAYAYDGRGGVTIAGVDLPADRVLLYPGSYRSDRTQTDLLTSGGDRFDVDGDPATPSEIFSTVELAPAVGRAAAEVAIAHARACDSSASCAVMADEAISMLDQPWVMHVDPVTGAIDLMLQLRSRAFEGQTRDLRLRAIVDEAGSLVSWECSDAGAADADLEPCRG